MKKRWYLIFLCVFLVGCQSEKEALRHEVEDLKSLLEESQVQVVTLQEALDHYKEHNQVLSENIAVLDKELRDLVSEKVELMSDIEDKTTMIVSLEEEVEQLKNDLNIAEGQKEMKVISSGDGGFHYMITNKEHAIYTVNIIVLGDETYIGNETYETLALDAPGTGELLKLQVVGTIYDFQVIELEWDASINDLKDVEVLKEVPKITNTTILLETYLACGIPSGKVKWKDAAGKTYEYHLSQDGYGFSGSVIICE